MAKNKTPKNPLNDEQKSTIISWAINVLNTLLSALLSMFGKKQKKDPQE